MFLKKSLVNFSQDHNMVRKERLELSRLAALVPKTSVSTNSTTLAMWLARQGSNLRPDD
jgi:hypothetical protein